MKVVWTIILTVLTLLAVSSGATKVLLMQQDVEFFGKYGFSDPILIAYGAVQLIGGVLLPFKEARILGAAIVAITFIISLVLLLLDRNLPLSIVTGIATVLLGLVMVRNWRVQTPKS